jgi:AcrR family transcriptional regulator
MNNFANESFKRLSPEKQDRILKAAIAEFAERGYELANTNRIAKRAKISVGSIFHYFTTKENLFLYIVQYGSAMIEEYAGKVVDDETLTVAQKIEALLRLAVKSSREEETLIRLYHETSSIGNQELVSKLPRSLEQFTSERYIKMLEEGQRKGEVKPELDARFAAFSMDNIFLSLQFAYACDYYRIRFQMYNHPEIDRETYDEQVISEAFQFLKGALLVPED